MALVRFNYHAQELPKVFSRIAYHCSDAYQSGLDDEIAVGTMSLLLRGHSWLYAAHRNPKSRKERKNYAESKENLHRLLTRYNVDRDGIRYFDLWLKDYEKNARSFWLEEKRLEQG